MTSEKGCIRHISQITENQLIQHLSLVRAAVPYLEPLTQKEVTFDLAVALRVNTREQQRSYQREISLVQMELAAMTITAWATSQYPGPHDSFRWDDS
ncbi:hypothetical protein T265_04054 [Opisthorchis viverrini]|uniref:Uncharacterized protein n=1 Tax=Opisthorchis viverrini TaxID=6198 RepID=A0A074ZQD5_OPIVI|nr:hypothetical protein T265_04054 [Opisthorchis viverrini]KER29311.1 hypothetical protein T265_04054 [Opisthorchis viverrini]